MLILDVLAFINFDFRFETSANLTRLDLNQLPDDADAIQQLAADTSHSYWSARLRGRVVFLAVPACQFAGTCGNAPLGPASGRIPAFGEAGD